MNKINKVIFDDIYFSDLLFTDLLEIFKKKSLILAPSGPGLSTIDKDKYYKHALRNADINIFDSGLFVILLSIIGIKVRKFSGYLFFSYLVDYLSKHQIKNYLFVDPDKKNAEKNFQFMSDNGIPSEYQSYIAPRYSMNKVYDYSLLNYINSHKPKFIIINLGGGIQEKLGAWLKDKLDYHVIIICTGAAISFFTKEQNSVNYFFDKFYLGWLSRCLSNPKVFIPRYVKTLRLIFIFAKFKLMNKISISSIRSNYD